MFKHHTKKNENGQLKKDLPGGHYLIDKYRGETLADLLVRFRKIHYLDSDTKLTYAGRLDPMAEGLVLILAGESRFDKDKFLGLSKTYTLEVLFGVGSDSLDVLGEIKECIFSNIDEDSIKKTIEKMTEIELMDYPIYSSRPVDGKPLFDYARKGKEVVVPKKKVKIFKANFLSTRKERLKNVIPLIVSDVQKVRGDFRQENIIENWKKMNVEVGEKEVQIVTIEINASSGTYMRSLAKWLGEQLEIPALAYRIVRSRIGEHHLKIKYK